MKDLVSPRGWRASGTCSTPLNGTKTLREDQGDRKDPGIHEGRGRKVTSEETKESRGRPQTLPSVTTIGGLASLRVWEGDGQRSICWSHGQYTPAAIGMGHTPAVHLRITLYQGLIVSLFPEPLP